MSDMTERTRGKYRGDSPAFGAVGGTDADLNARIKANARKEPEQEPKAPLNRVLKNAEPGLPLGPILAAVRGRNDFAATQNDVLDPLN